MPHRHPCPAPSTSLHARPPARPPSPKREPSAPTPLYDLTGKVAVITGAASGMGQAAAILFAQQGANVVLADLNTKGGEAAADEASASGRPCVFPRADVSQEADVEALIGRAVSEFGKLDILFNNAGIGGAVGPLEDIAVDDWDRTQAVCLRGVFLGIKHAIGPMRADGGGRSCRPRRPPASTGRASR